MLFVTSSKCAGGVTLPTSAQENRNTCSRGYHTPCEITLQHKLSKSA
jgi:hypothetical protein